MYSVIEIMCNYNAGWVVNKNTWIFCLHLAIVEITDIINVLLIVIGTEYETWNSLQKPFHSTKTLTNNLY